MFVYELSGCGFESRCSRLNFRYHACFKQEVPWYSDNYRVWIHSETRTLHDKNISHSHSFLWKIQNGFFHFFNNEKLCFISGTIYMSSKTNLLHCLWISSQHFLFTLCYCYHLIFQNKDNPANNRLCNHLLDQLQSFEWFHMFSYHFLLAN